MDKRGQIDSFWGIVLLVGILIALIFIGFLFAIGAGVANWATDLLVPEISNLGMVGSTNMTQISDIALNPVSNIIHSANFFGGLIYIIGIIGVLGLAFVYRVSAQKWLIPLFFILMFVLIIMCIFMSNIYESIYTGTDEIARSLQAQPILSYLLLYSPAIMALIGFIGGAIMFSGGQPNE
jgi:hypothetical protein